VVATPPTPIEPPAFVAMLVVPPAWLAPPTSVAGFAVIGDSPEQAKTQRNGDKQRPNCGFNRKFIAEGVVITLATIAPTVAPASPDLPRFRH
jgi:hypothetical protein